MNQDNKCLKELEELQNKQTVMNNIITEMKNTLKGINSRRTEAEEQISELGDRVVEITAIKQNTERGIKRTEKNSLGQY